MWEQIRNNALAIISLCVAFSALGYNTWRNELTEQNRNVRQAGFEMLLHIGELQQITYLAHYDMDLKLGNPRRGWTEVLVLKDLNRLMPDPAMIRIDNLYKAWDANWQGLGGKPESIQPIDIALDDLRSDVLTALMALE